MSTKINVRSPFYISYDTPVAPTPEFVAATAELTNFTVNAEGVVGLPDVTYGVILRYDSADPDFSDGKFSTVSTETNRTVTFYVEVPQGFSNAGDTIEIDASDIQEATAAGCSAVIDADGTVPNQQIDVGGNTVTVDMTQYFTGTGTIDYYAAYNGDRTGTDISISPSTGTLYITSKTITGSFYVVVDAKVSSTECGATQTVPITVTANEAFVPADARPLGGGIAPDGTITKPSVNGTITAIRLTSGGSPITSHTANDTGSSRQVTLFFDVTVPDGYTNTGSTVQTSVTYTQEAQNVTPTFDVNTVDFDDQAILKTGQVIGGTAEDINGDPVTIQSFSPTSFPTVNSVTSRDVTFTVVIPSGYQNAGTTVTKVISLDQPPTDVLETQSCTGANTKVFVGYGTNFSRGGGGRGLIARSTGGSAGYDYTNFDYEAHHCTYEAFISVSSIFQLKGQYICLSGSPLGFSSPRGTELTSINTYKTLGTTTTTDPIEYIISFDTNKQVKHLYRKDWQTRTIEKVF